MTTSMNGDARSANAGAARGRTSHPHDSDPRPIDLSNLDLSTPLTAATAYTRAGLRVIPVPHASKCPRKPRWQDLRLTERDLREHFGKGPSNIGVLLGEPSLGLLDVDLDSPEAVALAPAFLPQTDAIFGRGGKPSSHWLYQSAGPAPKSERLTDGEVCLVELRSTGMQTVFPPSSHEGTGESIRFDRVGVAAVVDPASLRTAVRRLGAAALLARRWQPGVRHDLALALAGWLLDAGWSSELAEECIGAIARASGDEEIDDRLAAIASTRMRIDAGEPTSGRAKAEEVIGRDAAGRIRKWLSLGKGTGRTRSRGPSAVYLPTPEGITVGRSGGQWADGQLLTNFTARIVGEIVEDDGDQLRRMLDLECELAGQTRRFLIPSTRFRGMDWVMEHLGAGAIIEPGPANRERAAVAIQKLSDSPIGKTTVYTHTGWRETSGTGWVYLHAGGAIGAGGAVGSVETRLEGSLSKFVLPAPPAGEDLVTAIQASLRLCEVGKARITAPLFASIWRAVLGGADSGLFLVGPTGVFKSEVASLAQRHFGKGMDRLRLPGSWSSTENALEDVLFRAKDTLFTIDDFKPSGHAREDATLYAKAERVIRGVGNGSGRQRMRQDASLMAPRPPGALPLATGEDLPRGHSLRARQFFVEVHEGDIDVERLTQCQRDAEAGLYAAAMAGFIRWLASRYPDVLRRLRSAATDLGREFTFVHRRTPAFTAELLFSLDLFLEFVAEATGEEAITKPEAGALRSAWRAAVLEAAAMQASVLREADPVDMYLELLRSAIASGRAHVADREGEPPPNHAAWGWRRVAGELRAQGDRIGWLVDGELHLNPTAAFNVARAMAEPAESLAVSEHRLRKLLKARGLLLRAEEARGKLLCRTMLEGARRGALCLSAGALHAEMLDGPEPAG